MTPHPLLVWYPEVDGNTEPDGVDGSMKPTAMMYQSIFEYVTCSGRIDVILSSNGIF